MIETHIPISISGVWYPEVYKEAKFSGSIGISLVLEPYTVFEIRKSESPEVYMNGLKINFPNILILKKLGNLKIQGIAKVPLGYGYGLSASISLAYALGAYEIFNVKKDIALETAHESEVISNNGLGDIISQYYGGGLIYRKKPGAPNIGEIEIIDVDWHKLFSKPIERLSTRSIIKPIKEAKILINEFLKYRTLEKFFDVSRKFAELLGYSSPYPLSFRKKGLIIKMDKPEEGVWIEHSPARHGAYIT